MKKGFILLILGTFICLLGYSQKNEVLLKIDGQDVTKAEFVRIYKKNNTKAVIDKKSLEEYLELFINFKLKVLEAEKLGLDTSESFRNELAGYRKQLVKPYLVDSSVDEQLMKEAFERMQYDIRASHILISVQEDASPADSLRAYNKIVKIRESILNGEDFAKVAKNQSDDPSAKVNGGDLGYFTVFQMVYPFESAAYNTKPGEISKPIRTRFGYHIIKIEDKRKAQGQIKVAHIMISVPKDSDEAKKKEAEGKINNIYSKLQSGTDFKELAKEFSDDKGSSKNGGELPWFGTGRMVPEFEIAAFDLKNDDDFSKPVKTDFGWHIIKRIDRKELGKFEDLKAEIKNKLSRDARASQSKTAVIEKLKKEYDLKINQKSLAAFYKVVDNTIFEGAWDMENAKSLDKELFVFADEKMMQQDFAKHLSTQKRKRAPMDIKVYVDDIFNQYVDDIIIKYEESHLEDKYEDFKYLMKEYHDGILLFELTDQMVWSKAVKDTAGLDSFYEQNKQKYMWTKRVDATMLKYKDEMALNDISKHLEKRSKKGYTLEQILDLSNKKDSANLIVLESKKYAEGDNNYLDDIYFKNSKNDIADYYILKEEQKIYLINNIIEPQPKTLNEAKGIVTADYQTFLEEKWIKELRSKYNVEIDQKVLSTIK